MPALAAGGSLAIGELFGAGTFVTTVVFGAVSFVAPFTLTRRPFLRDCVTYFVATIYLFVVMLKGSITLGESVGFLIIYIAYVCVVVFGRKIYQARKKRQLAEQGLGLDDDDDDDRLLLTAVTTNNIYEGDPEFEQNKGHAPHHDAHHHNHTSDLAMKAARKGSYGIDDLAAHAARAPIYEDSQLQLHSVEEDDEEPQADKESVPSPPPPLPFLPSPCGWPLGCGAPHARQCMLDRRLLLSFIFVCVAGD